MPAKPLPLFLEKSGAITAEEYQKTKQSLLKEINGEKYGQPPDEKSWALFIHLSQFCGFLLPLLGMVVPIVLWQIKKNESAAIDTHGRIVANWILSSLIYFIVAGLLCLIIIGIPLVIALALLCIVFPIIGAVKAYDGKLWRYPLSINFFQIRNNPQNL